MSLSREQIEELLRPISKDRVSTDGKGFAHVEAWDIRRTMNRIFGFANWSARVEQMELVSEREVQTRQGKPAWNVVYRARCVLDVGDDGFLGATYAEWAAGDATNPTLADAHDQAIKTAESQAFKRCAVNLGDQFGLSLYRNGSTDATVGDVIGREHADSGQVPDLEDLLESAADRETVDHIAERIRSLDISGADKATLRAAYSQALARIEEAAA